MSLGTRAVVAWFFLFVAMFANGAARVLLLQPRLGAPRARQLASVTGLALVLPVSLLFVRMSPQATSRPLLWVGVGWGVATVAFEFLFGHFASGLGWSELPADYNILKGRLWPLVVLSVCLGPGSAASCQERGNRQRAGRLRGPRPKSDDRGRRGGRQK